MVTSCILMLSSRVMSAKHKQANTVLECIQEMMSQSLLTIKIFDWGSPVVWDLHVLARGSHGSFLVPGPITWINGWMAAGEKMESTVPLCQRDFHESWGISPPDLCECRHVTWAAEQCAVICTKKVLVLLKHQRQEQAQASTVKLSNTSPVCPAPHSSHAALHQDSKCNFTSMALNF